MVKNLDAFERVMWPAMADRVRDMVALSGRANPRGRPAESGGAERHRRRRSAAPIVKPRRPRKLLVTDLQMYSGHSTIPHGNWLLELMGKYTGAFEPVFSNDLELLKYPRIKEFDAVYLNNVCGMVHNDPGRARRPAPLRPRRRRPRRPSRRDLRQQQLARVRRDDGGLGRRPSHREADAQGRRSGQPAHEELRGRELRAHATSSTSSRPTRPTRAPSSGSC